MKNKYKAKKINMGKKNSNAAVQGTMFRRRRFFKRKNKTFLRFLLTSQGVYFIKRQIS